MRKLVQAFLIICMVVLSAQVAFANSDKVTVYEGANLSSIHRLAIGRPLYTPVAKEDPTIDDLTEAVASASKVARCYVVPYNDMAQGIRADKGIDIKALDRRKAAAEFKKSVAKYADAYVILTVANNSGITFFFDIYKSGSDELLYTYEITANRSEKASVETYRTLSEQFFKHFERSAEEQQKKTEKEAKKKK